MLNGVDKIKSDPETMEAVVTSDALMPAEKQGQDNVEAEARNENGPWSLWGELKPPATKIFCACECPSESALLTDILIRYGNNPENLPALHYAILKNDIVAVDLLLKHGASPFTVSNGNNCLYYAIKAGSLPLVKKFIDFGVSVEHVSSYAEDALLVAQHFNQPEIVKYLESLNREREIEQLTIINVKYGNNLDNLPTLHYAIVQGDVAAVDLLLKYGADPFTKNMHALQEYNSLYYAIKYGSVPIFKKLLELGLDINSIGNASINGGGIHKVVIVGHPEIIKYVISYLDFPLKVLLELPHYVANQHRFTTEQKNEIIQLINMRISTTSRVDTHR